MEELKRDARTIRAIIRKYSIDPSQYSAVLPLHPASIAQITRTRCLTVADVVGCNVWAGLHLFDVGLGGNQGGVEFLMKGEENESCGLRYLHFRKLFPESVRGAVGAVL
jgi:hypothetical protein